MLLLLGSVHLSYSVLAGILLWAGYLSETRFWLSLAVLTVYWCMVLMFVFMESLENPQDWAAQLKRCWVRSTIGCVIVLPLLVLGQWNILRNFDRYLAGYSFVAASTMAGVVVFVVGGPIYAHVCMVRIKQMRQLLRRSS